MAKLTITGIISLFIAFTCFCFQAIGTLMEKEEWTVLTFNFLTDGAFTDRVEEIEVVFLKNLLLQGMELELWIPSLAIGFLCLIITGFSKK